MDRPILFINACVRGESRTKKLAEKLLEKLNRPVEEVRLEEINFPIVDEDFLNMRDRLISEGSLDSPVFDLARQFSDAETIVIAAPYWDLSFPGCTAKFSAAVIDSCQNKGDNGSPHVDRQNIACTSARCTSLGNSFTDYAVADHHVHAGGQDNARHTALKSLHDCRDIRVLNDPAQERHDRNDNEKCRKDDGESRHKCSDHSSLCDTDVSCQIYHDRARRALAHSDHISQHIFAEPPVGHHHVPNQGDRCVSASDREKPHL